MKYARWEFERCYRLAGPLPGLDHSPAFAIEDRYFPDLDLRLRRLVREDTGEATYKLTQKRYVSFGRAEITTIYLEAEGYARFAALDANVLRKRRHHLERDGQRWVVDAFEHGLWLAEIEFESEEALLAFPGPSFDAVECTGDPSVAGSSLANR